MRPPRRGAGPEIRLQPAGPAEYGGGWKSRPAVWLRMLSTHARQAGLDARPCQLVAPLGDGPGPGTMGPHVWVPHQKARWRLSIWLMPANISGHACPVRGGVGGGRGVDADPECGVGNRGP